MKNFIFLLSLFIGSMVFAFDNHPMDVVNPDDDELLGSLIVKSPAIPKGLQLSTYSVGAPGLILVPDQSARIKEGNYCVFLGSSYSVQKCNVSVVRKQTTEVALGAFHIKLDLDNLSTDVGPQPQIRILDRYGKAVQLTDSYQATFENLFIVTFENAPIFGEIQIPVGVAEIVEKSISYPDLRAQIEFKASVRAFPNADGSDFTQINDNLTFIHRKYPLPENTRMHIPQYGYDRAHGTYDRSGLVDIVNFIDFQTEKPQAIWFFPTLNQSPLFYEVVVNNTYTNIAMKAGEHKTVTLKRIDVNKVLLTREDGSKYYVAGTYKVYQQNPTSKGWRLLEILDKNKEIVSEFHTETGLDVLPGTYKVELTYLTAEGKKSRDYILNLN